MTPDVRPFGATGLSVPRVALGAAASGDRALSDGQAESFLHGALDLGVTLLDTARSYGLSEDRIGRFLSGRRGAFLLSTKVGYGVPGYADWTGPTVDAGIDLALRTLRTDVIDIVHLHSCPLETLRRGDVVEALARAVSAGKVRVAAYSGDNEALDWAVASGRFGSVQASVNVCDQRALFSGTLRMAKQRGLGVLAKRSLANAPWRAGASRLATTHESSPTSAGDRFGFAAISRSPRSSAGDLAVPRTPRAVPQTPWPPDDAAASAYRDRWREMALDLGGLSPEEFALRFTLSQPEVDAAIVGTRSLDHLRRAVEAAQRGPLPEPLRLAGAEAFARRGGAWRSLI